MAILLYKFAVFLMINHLRENSAVVQMLLGWLSMTSGLKFHTITQMLQPHLQGIYWPDLLTKFWVPAVAHAGMQLQCVTGWQKVETLCCVYMSPHECMRVCSLIHISRIYTAQISHLVYAHTHMHTQRTCIILSFPSFHSINGADINRKRKYTHMYTF